MAGGAARLAWPGSVGGGRNVPGQSARSQLALSRAAERDVVDVVGLLGSARSQLALSRAAGSKR